MSKDSAPLCISIKITIFIEFSNPLLVQMSMQNEITIYDKYSYELKKNHTILYSYGANIIIFHSKLAKYITCKIVCINLKFIYIKMLYLCKYTNV